MGLIASNTLLIAAPPDHKERILTRLRSKGISATVIGEITDRSEGIKLITADGIRDLPLYEQDEITRI
jgi:hydrogenase maturation factor